MPVIGLDLGGTKLAAAILGEDGTIVHRAQCRLEGRGGDPVGQLVTDQLDEFLAYGRSHNLAIGAVGVSVPGIYHRETGTVWAPNIPGWESYPLRDLLQSRAGTGVAVAIDSDRACSILGETARGAARGCRHAIFLAVGTGIGAGILVDGRVLRGAHDIAGAVGWMALDRPYRTEYDACGCFESQASGAGIAHQARRRLAESPDQDGPLRRIDPARLTARDVFAAFDQGDALAEAVLADAVACWGMAVANLVSLFNPEVVVLGGGLFGPAARLLDRIVAEARRWAQPVSIQRVAIRVTTLGPEACLYGTGQLALGALRTPSPFRD
ncbi:MAG TPA: ROK family protein [Isosphaeraceae bacterium]|nr:ROK family protein [Isosphaeraceae bacterium]